MITETYAETLQSKEVDRFGLKVDKTNETVDGRTMKYSGDVVYEDIHRCMK